MKTKNKKIWLLFNPYCNYPTYIALYFTNIVIMIARKIVGTYKSCSLSMYCDIFVDRSFKVKQWLVDTILFSLHPPPGAGGPTWFSINNRFHVAVQEYWSVKCILSSATTFRWNESCNNNYIRLVRYVLCLRLFASIIVQVQRNASSVCEGLRPEGGTSRYERRTTHIGHSCLRSIYIIIFNSFWN